MTEKIKLGMTKKKNVIPPAVAGGIHNIFYILISLFFTTLIALVPTFLALAANVPSNFRIEKASISSTAITIAWSNSATQANHYNDIWVNGRIYASISTGAANVTYAVSGLASGVNYKVKVRSRDNAGTTDWSFAAAGITKSSTGAFVAPHANFIDNSNMCSACHSIHKSRTKYKLLYSKYSELAAEYSTALSTAAPQVMLPGVDMCFNCHDGSAANYNVKKHYDQSTSIVFSPGHMIRGASTNTSGYGYRPIIGLPQDNRLPCMICHDTHVSSLRNWKMMSDELYRYAKTGVAGSVAYGNTYGGPWPASVNVPDETNNDSRITPTDAGGTAWEKCTVCHHRAGSNQLNDKVMVVAGRDLNWPTAAGQNDHSGRTGCSCHVDPNDTGANNNVHALGSKPNSPQTSCGTDASCHPDVTARTMSSAFTSRHYLVTDANQDQPSTNADRCTSRCHNNHGQRTPNDAYNLYTNAANITSLSGTANYDYTAAPSANSPGLCLSCHQSTRQSPITTSNSTKTVSAISPTPFAQSAHSYPSTNYVGGSGRIYSMTCLKCHMDSNQSTTYAKYGPHASANRSLLRWPETVGASAVLGGNAGDEEQTCFRCHSPSKDQWANSGIATIAWRISAAFTQDARIVGDYWQGTEGHALYLMSTTVDRHRATEGTAFNFKWMPSTARHVECQDCHNPHAATYSYNQSQTVSRISGVTSSLMEAQTGRLAASLTGGWGVSVSFTGLLTAANYTVAAGPPAANYTLLTAGTNTLTKQWQLCLKCHSSYGYGTSSAERPIVPSGSPIDLLARPQTDQVLEFNPANFGYHPVFVPGKNQPTMGANPNWRGIYGRNSVAYDVTGGAGPGLTTTFVPPWGASSLVTCSDCHGYQSSSYSRNYYTLATQQTSAFDWPRGPHGSLQRWLLRRTDRSIRFRRNNNTTFSYGFPMNAGTAEAAADRQYTEHIFCFNCHRADIYGYPNGAPYDANLLARINHGDMDNGRGDPWATPGGPQDSAPQIFCMYCHMGGTRGGSHGSSKQRMDATYSAPMGRRLLNGAKWIGYNAPQSSNTMGCAYANNNGEGESVSGCTTSSTGRGTANAAQVNYAYQ